MPRLFLSIKKRFSRAKYWIKGYTKEEVFIRCILSDKDGDSIKEVGLLIAAAFMGGECMSNALAIAFKRISEKEGFLFSKTRQYYRALLFLQKVCMQSEAAKEAIRRNYLKILPFVFYSRGASKEDAEIRVLSISIIKTINEQFSFCEKTYTTYVTCISPKA